MDRILIGKLFLVLVLIVGNAFFVGSEIALTFEAQDGAGGDIDDVRVTLRLDQLG